MNDLLDPEKNPVYGLSYEDQIVINQLPIAQARTLKRNMIGREHAHPFKRAKVSLLTNKHKAARVQFGKDYQHETVWSHWQFVYFTDEAHFDATEIPRDYVLRREGDRYEPENVQQMPDKGGVDLHCAASISWWHKGPIEFYNDEHDEPPSELLQPSYPPRPRRRPKTESEDAYPKRLTDWEANKPHDVEVKKKGNSMTIAYYCERLLPLYIDQIHKARMNDDWDHPGRAILQEDGDPSHGTIGKSDNKAKSMRKANWIETYLHPSESPDLNPIEGIWLRLKAAVRRCQGTRLGKRNLILYG